MILATQSVLFYSTKYKIPSKLYFRPTIQEISLSYKTDVETRNRKFQVSKLKTCPNHGRNLYALAGLPPVLEYSSSSTTRVVNYSSNFFTARRSYASAVLGVVILSVRPSHTCFVTNPKNLLAIFLHHSPHERAILLVFLMPKISAKFQRGHSQRGRQIEVG